MTCFCMPWSMFGNLKIQILEIIIMENLWQNLKFQCETAKFLGTKFELPRFMSFMFGYEHNEKNLRN